MNIPSEFCHYKLIPVLAPTYWGASSLLCHCHVVNSSRHTSITNNNSTGRWKNSRISEKNNGGTVLKSNWVLTKFSFNVNVLCHFPAWLANTRKFHVCFPFFFSILNYFICCHGLTPTHKDTPDACMQRKKEEMKESVNMTRGNEEMREAKRQVLFSIFRIFEHKVHNHGNSIHIMEYTDLPLFVDWALLTGLNRASNENIHGGIKQNPVSGISTSIHEKNRRLHISYCRSLQNQLGLVQLSPAHLSMGVRG